MAESIARPGVNENEEPGKTIETVDEQNTEETGQPATTSAASTIPSTVIWTPRFMVIFALTFVSGMSAESLLTQGWKAHYYAGQWISLGHIAIIAVCLIALIKISHSRWIRVGAIFGCIWAIFASINLIVTFFTLDPASPIPAYLNAAVSSALFGSYICLSIERTLLGAWDTWFFRIVIIVVLCTVTLVYFITPAVNRSLSTIDSTIATLALVFSILVWWLRSSCWKRQPGPTFLLGFTPALILLLTISSLGKGPTNFFLSQVALLALLLGIMRILQGELRKR